MGKVVHVSGVFICMMMMMSEFRQYYYYYYMVGERVFGELSITEAQKAFCHIR